MLSLEAFLGAAPPDDARAALARAVALHQAGNLEAAVAAYRESLALAPSVEGRSNLGAVLAALGRYGEAIEAYRGALALAPGDGRIRYNLALAYYKSADLSRAAEELAAVHAAQPGDLRATLLLADCRLQLGEPAAVEALLRPLAVSRPDDRAVTYLLGMALVRGGKVEEGQKLVETLMRDGDTAEAQYLVGSAAFMAGDYPRAVERFSSALQKNPGCRRCGRTTAGRSSSRGTPTGPSGPSARPWPRARTTTRPATSWARCSPPRPAGRRAALRGASP